MSQEYLMRNVDNHMSGLGMGMWEQWSGGFKIQVLIEHGKRTVTIKYSV